MREIADKGEDLHDGMLSPTDALAPGHLGDSERLSP
jgi:hypothetical protein